MKAGASRDAVSAGGWSPLVLGREADGFLHQLGSFAFFLGANKGDTMHYKLFSVSNILFIVFLFMASCASSYNYQGTKYELNDEHAQYLDEVQRDLRTRKTQWEENGLSKTEQMKEECKALSKWAKNAPSKKKVKVLYWSTKGEDAPNSAQNILMKQRDQICDLSKAVEKREREEAKAKRDEQRRKEQAKSRAADEERKQKREQAEAEEETAKLAYKAKLQKTVWTIGKLECGVVDFANIGERIEGDYELGVTASGTYVGALVKCYNSGNKTERLLSNTFKMVDGAGRQFDIDSQGSMNYAVFLKKPNQKNPQFVEIHPGLAVSIVAVFDVPATILSDPKLTLVIAKKAKYPLVFGE